jgi:hypothetical protein
MKSESGDMGVPAPLFSNIFIVVSGVPGSSITSGTTSCNAADLSVELKVAGAAPVFVTVTVFSIGPPPGRAAQTDCSCRAPAANWNVAVVSLLVALTKRQLSLAPTGTGSGATVCSQSTASKHRSSHSCGATGLRRLTTISLRKNAVLLSFAFVLSRALSWQTIGFHEKRHKNASFTPVRLCC